MKRAVQHQLHFHVALTSSVRARLTLWYLVMVACIVCLFGVSLYMRQTSLNADIAEREAQFYQDSQRFAETYGQALLDHQTLATLHLNLSSQEIVLLLRPDGNALDARGPLTGSLIQQLQAGAEQNKGMIYLAVPKTRSHAWWTVHTTSHVLVTPVLNQNMRVALLLVGLPFPDSTFPGIIWFFHGLLAVLAAAVGGYWLAGKALQPVKTITRMANEINATDLRRRLHLQRPDEFGELAATFDHMLARLEAAFKRQTQFTADASHELRTPLTIIGLELNRALTQLELPEAYRQTLAQIQAENERMAAIINRLLLLARADTGQIALDLQEVDLGDLALACVERLLPLARTSQIALTTGDLPEVLIHGDPHYLEQMLTNLIENGIKYSRHIGKRVYVEVACEPPLWGVVRVRDDGPGVTDEHLPSLFERFYRVDKARSSRQKGSTRSPLATQEEPGGTGLGLSIVQWIVQAHQGEIRVESKIGAGSLFEVRLPRSGRSESRSH
jgi:signal transduction histidine kinase